MIHIFNSSRPGERMIPLAEVQVIEMKMDHLNRPYILFEHRDFPLGALMAYYDGECWACDLD
jgi:hypothetical protein